MSTSSCRPQRLREFAPVATGVTNQVTTRAGQLEDALNDYALRCDGNYCAQAADTSSIVRAWGNGYHALGTWTANVGQAFEKADAADRLAHPPEGQGPVKTFDDARLGEADVDDAVARVHRALDTGGFGVTASDLDAIRDVFDHLSPAEREALVMRLSDHDLKVWGDQMCESRYKGGWSIQERDAFFSKLLPHLSTDAIDRLASTNPYLRPKFDGKHEYGAPEYWRTRDPFDPTIDDINQGHSGDCYFLAALGAVTYANPDLVRKMVRRNANGTYTVTFHRRGEWNAKSSTFEVTVLPAFPNGLRDDPAQTDDEFYMQIIEKAWAQHGEGYDKVGGSRPGIPLEFLTGHESSYSNVKLLGDLDPIETALSDKRALTATTPEMPGKPFPKARVLLPDGNKATIEIPYSHVYIVTGVRTPPGGKEKMIVLHNPWGGENADFLLTPDQFTKYFVFYTEVPR